MSQVRSVRVWDPAVRAFHWGLATSILVAWLTSDEWKSAHIWVGYFATALVAFRIVWGFTGSPYCAVSVLPAFAGERRALSGRHGDRS